MTARGMGKSRGGPVADSDTPVAGGWGALLASARILLRERAVIPGTAALLKVNQPGGFDCPGCAWPEGERIGLDFCENGLKAVAAETTSKRADPSFFAGHTVAALRLESDHWLE